MQKSGFAYKEHRTIEVKAYSFHMTEKMLDVFKRFAGQYIRDGRRPLAKGELGLNPTEYNNFGFLQHFGIIGRVGKRWALSEKGEMFYTGRIGILSPCGHFDGKTLHESHPAWQTFRGKRKEIRINDRPEEKLQTHDDYAAEAAGDTLGI